MRVQRHVRTARDGGVLDEMHRTRWVNLEEQLGYPPPPYIRIPYRVLRTRDKNKESMTEKTTTLKALHEKIAHGSRHLQDVCAGCA